MTLLTKAEAEATIGAPLDRWCTYYLAITLNCRVSRQPFGSEWFWLAVAKLDEGDRIRDPNKSWFRRTMKLMSDEALVAAIGGAQALIEGHEELGEFETAQTLRAAQAVARAELTKRHQWDA